MTSSLSLFCEECGAANTEQATLCFACKQPLHAASVVPAPVHTLVEPIDLTTFTSTSAGPLLPDSLLHQRYRIIEQIGQGGFGVVYKARDTHSKNHLVAIKQINLRALNTREIIEATDSYNREITLLSKLKHANLPHIFDHFTDPEHWYLVMEFIRGGTLEDYLKQVRRGRLSVKKVVRIGTELSTVLSYLHAQKPPIIFRDVKPMNIMCTRRGRLYLIDFGIARRFTPGKAKDTGPLGSPGFAAPEQYGRTQTTAQTDIYGLGATLQMLLTGNDPSEGLGAASSAPRHRSAKKLQQLLDQMLERDASKRPQSMEEVKQRLQRIKRDISGMLAKHALAYGHGLLLGLIPYAFVLLMLSIFYLLLLNTSFNFIFFVLDLVLLCLFALFFFTQLIKAIEFLFSSSKRLMGLGILTMETLLVVTILWLLLSGTFRYLQGFFS